MDKILTNNVQQLITQLIFGISGFDESSEYFKQVQEFAYSHICSPDYFFTYTKSDIIKTCDNLSTKFKFHGFAEQATYFNLLIQKLFDSAKSSDDTETFISIMKLLLNISHSPTTHFLENIDDFKPKIDITPEEIDWKLHLNDCKIKIKHNFEEISDDDVWSEFSDESSYDDVVNASVEEHIEEVPRVSDIKKLNLKDAAKNAKLELYKTIQSHWWDLNEITVIPSSDSLESKVAIEWDKFVNNLAMGLINRKTNIIPEYRIMRELIWQFFAPHPCFSFGFEDDILKPKNDVTIGSLRPHTFQYFMYEFLPYIEMLKTFRAFQDNLKGDYFVTSIPDTYRSYSEALDEIVSPVYEILRQIENKIRKQDEIITILTIAAELRPIFKKIEILYAIHLEINKKFTVDNSCQNSTFLLSRLYFGILNNSSLVEQNIFLTLYLKSLYKYFTIIEIWLKQDFLDDETDEFIIFENKKNRHKLIYELKNLEPFSHMDGMLNIISTKVLQLAKNIHLLRQLGKLHLVTEDIVAYKDSLHDEFINKVLEEVNTYMPNSEIASKPVENPLNLNISDSEVKKNSLDCVENFLELSDGFLATVFEPFIYKDEDKLKNTTSDPQTLYERINKEIVKIFPAKQILEKTFLDVLNRRYSIPGLLVKNILINQFDLMKYFEILNHLYLFKDDIIFPFYKKMFLQFHLQQAWGNFFWLTSQLQDLLMDIYPDFYENCRVDVDQTWRLCNNPISACDLVTLHVRIDWPINLIVRQEHINMYNRIFQFILKIKWALNTLNKLQFLDLEPRNKLRQHPNLIQQRVRKLQAMRFVLLNDISSIQHYILGHLFSVVLKKFEETFSATYDLESIIKCHEIYIRLIYKFCMKLKNEKSDTYGFKKILNLVLLLQNMWKNILSVDDNVLKNCEVDYRNCHKFLRPIIEVEVNI